MKTVEKTLDILEVFLNSGKEVGISDLAEITGQNVSTIHSILRELVEKGYIRQRKSRGKYSLGLKFLSFTDTVNKMMAIEYELKTAMFCTGSLILSDLKEKACP